MSKTLTKRQQLDEVRRTRERLRSQRRRDNFKANKEKCKQEVDDLSAVVAEAKDIGEGSKLVISKKLFTIRQLLDPPRSLKLAGRPSIDATIALVDLADSIKELSVAEEHLIKPEPVLPPLPTATRSVSTPMETEKILCSVNDGDSVIFRPSSAPVHKFRPIQHPTIILTKDEEDQLLMDF
jgi:hypothetical protein